MKREKFRIINHNTRQEEQGTEEHQVVSSKGIHLQRAQQLELEVHTARCPLLHSKTKNILYIDVSCRDSVRKYIAAARTI